MYKIYTTKAIILKSFSFAEADKSYEILTRDFGVIFADARGVRKIESKLKHKLLEFNDCEVSLVKGKERWRISNVESGFNFFNLLKDKKESLSVFKRIISLSRRLVPESEKNEHFFDILRNGAIFLIENNLQGKDLLNFECIAVLKILHCLGYLGQSPDFLFFVNSPVFDNRLIFEMSEKREEAILAINTSIKESHL
jgi:DNA repair protein RecO